MFEFHALDGSSIAGGLLVVLVLAFLRFGNRVIDLLLSRRSSPVEAVEQSISEQN